MSSSPLSLEEGGVASSVLGVSGPDRSFSVEERHRDLLTGKAATLSFKGLHYAVEVKPPPEILAQLSKGEGVTHPPAGGQHANDKEMELPAPDVVPEVTLTSPVPVIRNGKIKRFLLKNVSGIVEPGELLCIMGPTGSGKTTLLDTLAGRVQADKEHLFGEILINGRPRSSNFKHMASYVPQFEALTSTLTVEESLYFSAQMNLPSSMSREEKMKRVERVLDQLGLQSVRKSTIGGGMVSGLPLGHKKRVGIAVELISDPQIFFLDEPTTGLDSAAAMAVMNRIVSLAKEGRTVICSIHQPSPEVFAKFDKLALLSRGQIMYMGPAQEALHFFHALDMPVPSDCNPADFFLDVLNDDFEAAADLKLVRRAFEGSDFSRQIEARQRESEEWFHKNELTIRKVEKSSYQSSWWLQFSVLTRRNFLNYLRNPLIFIGRLILYVAICIILGTSFLDLAQDTSTTQSRIAVIFFCISFLSFMAVSSMSAFLEDKAVFVRERTNGAYGVSPFFVANTTISVPFVFLLSLLASVSGYFLIGLRGGADHFWIFTALLFLTLLTSESFVVLVSGLVPNVIMGLVQVIGLFGTLLLLSGFFVLPENIPGWWIWVYHLSYMTYSLRSMMYNEFDGQVYTVRGQPDVTITGNQILSRFSMNENNIGVDLGILLAWTVFFRLCFYLVLRFKQRGKR